MQDIKNIGKEIKALHMQNGKTKVIYAMREDARTADWWDEASVAQKASIEEA